LSGREIESKLTDDRGHDWRGLETVEPASDEKGKFIVTVKLGRQKHHRTIFVGDCSSEGCARLSFGALREGDGKERRDYYTDR